MSSFVVLVVLMWWCCCSNNLIGQIGHQCVRCRLKVRYYSSVRIITFFFHPRAPCPPPAGVLTQFDVTVQPLVVHFPLITTMHGPHFEASQLLYPVLESLESLVPDSCTLVTWASHAKLLILVLNLCAMSPAFSTCFFPQQCHTGLIRD